ncbi:hypothetical protein HOLleu_42986 [Holothuria leucospilota]|uniref:NACHT domain-containing protein n=1 Tax=Holothuria leucospilota TaxID=206669 RepID=A0A9Q0Y9W1_HOLLE|nr:hypothetical protein HOLleu_42986 [Holothuria leucospilota]
MTHKLISNKINFVCRSNFCFSLEKITIFKQELLEKYQRSWKTLRPVPYNTEVHYTVNEIYVASDIQCLEKAAHGEDGKLPIWQKLQSHKFLDPLCQSPYRLVLEGEPGYGKTYLGYLFAYEWSTAASNSPMKDVDIYILLRLRYLNDFSSIPKAIKKMLLPGNSSITDEDVASILFHSKSVVMYLDGFDRDDGTLRRGNFKTVTNFVGSLINCFHCKMSTVSDEHSAIKALCFDALSGDENFGVLWTKDEICCKLGKKVYEEYRGVGILVEKAFSRYNPSSCPNENNGVQYETKVRFFHGIFCQWYAAQALAEVITNSNHEDWMEYLNRINPYDHQYVYRFACGINREVAKGLIRCFRDCKKEDKFTILCIQEQTGNFGEVRDTIKQICSSSVSIDAYDTLFLQNSTVGLLKFAASDNVKNNSYLCIFKDKNEVAVDWKTPVHGCDWYSLDLKSGKWQRKGEIMSKEQYARMIHFSSCFKNHVEYLNGSIAEVKQIKDFQEDLPNCGENVTRLKQITGNHRPLRSLLRIF